MESIKSIIDWHTETFPEASLDGQITKFLDERVEYICATTPEEKLIEMADCFIVACGIARFNIVYGARFLGEAFDMFTEAKDVTIDALQKAIDAKMAINRQRKWGKGKGCYQHISEGEEHVG